VTEVPGLYFLGLYWQHTRGSALLGWVKADAEYLATQIQSLAGSRPARPDPADRAQPIGAEVQEDSQHVEPQ
jgi:putative flavoprotein involved in K+ transport